MGPFIIIEQVAGSRAMKLPVFQPNDSCDFVHLESHQNDYLSTSLVLLHGSTSFNYVINMEDLSNEQ